MGNCQAIDTATMVIQHPSGKSETMYWPVSANEIMKMNPGHYVALLITSTLYPNQNHHPPVSTAAAAVTNAASAVTNTATPAAANSLRITRIKLLRPNDTLVLGQVYRLITTQEVVKSLWAKKQSKMMKNKSESSAVNPEKKSARAETVPRRSEKQRPEQVSKHEQQQRQRTASTNVANARSKIWQPSLISISEAVTK